MEEARVDVDGAHAGQIEEPPWDDEAERDHDQEVRLQLAKSRRLLVFEGAYLPDGKAEGESGSFYLVVFEQVTPALRLRLLCDTQVM